MKIKINGSQTILNKKEGQRIGNMKPRGWSNVYKSYHTKSLSLITMCDERWGVEQRVHFSRG